MMFQFFSRSNEIQSETTTRSSFGIILVRNRTQNRRIKIAMLLKQ
jgi:hypothetical protein